MGIGWHWQSPKMFEIDDNSDKMNRILTPSLMSLFFIFRSVYVRFEWYLVNYSSSGNNFGSKWKEIKTKFFGGAIHKGRPQIFANFWHPWWASWLLPRHQVSESGESLLLLPSPPLSRLPHCLQSYIYTVTCSPQIFNWVFRIGCKDFRHMNPTA